MIERKLLTSMLKDVGIPPLAYSRRTVEGEEYSPDLYRFLEATAINHEAQTTYELMRVLVSDKTPTPHTYQFAVEVNDQVTNGMTHMAYLLDFPDMACYFCLDAEGNAPKDLGNEIEKLIYEKHAQYMACRSGIPFPENYVGVYPGPLKSIQLDHVYAIKIAAWNDSLEEHDLPPGVREDDAYYQ